MIGGGGGEPLGDNKGYRHSVWGDEIWKLNDGRVGPTIEFPVRQIK